MSFDLIKSEGLARAGILHTAHGDVKTPVFMPVATQGSVKSVSPDDLYEIGAQIILGNTYHLYLRPGVDLIQNFEGIHKFINWKKPVLTDSGGFQGFSLQHLRSIKSDGIEFKSHIDGTNHFFTPELTIKYQEKIGADIIMPLDVCLEQGTKDSEIQEAVKLTSDWAKKSKDVHSKKDQLLFGIVQGGLDEKLRVESTNDLIDIGFPGYAIGGLSVGESKPEMYKIAKFTSNLLPENKPRYLMGVGSPEDLIEFIAIGIDMFDCDLPTRVARNGVLFVDYGRINIYNAQFRDQDVPVQSQCKCYTCKNFSIGYLHHLFRTKEILYYRLATIHNLHHILKLIDNVRNHIISGDFFDFLSDFRSKYIPSDQKVRLEQKQKWLNSQRLKN